MKKSNVTVTVNFPVYQEGGEDGIEKRAQIQFNVEPVVVVRPIDLPDFNDPEAMKRHPLFNRMMDEINATVGKVFREHYQMGEYLEPLPTREEKPWRLGQ